MMTPKFKLQEQKKRKSIDDIISKSKILLVLHLIIKSTQVFLVIKTNIKIIKFYKTHLSLNYGLVNSMRTKIFNKILLN